jgi:hypothetical protein
MTPLQKAIDAVQEAVINLDVAQTDYERFATFDHPSAQIAYAQMKKPALVAAERQLIAACKLLKAAGWRRPFGLLPKPGEDLAHDPGAECPAHTHEEPPQNPDQDPHQR